HVTLWPAAAFLMVTCRTSRGWATRTGPRWAPVPGGAARGGRALVGSAPGPQPVADVLAALMAGPDRDALAGEAAASAGVRNRVGVPVPVSRSRHRRPPLLTSLLSAGAASAAAVAALSVGGFATAAFAGALPAPAQQFANHAFGAP